MALPKKVEGYLLQKAKVLRPRLHQTYTSIGLKGGLPGVGRQPNSEHVQNHPAANHNSDKFIKPQILSRLMSSLSGPAKTCFQDITISTSLYMKRASSYPVIYARYEFGECTFRCRTQSVWPYRPYTHEATAQKTAYSAANLLP